ncbi:sensor domain-containing diguanylate cyclase [Psychromonas ossibalaenae]|uniref:sensor domain-containing diguanylate cyclase n=1 Tax=Psychromonas ossibalaenae TaxID=444922 RepID=UPI000475C2EA|nr:sensor domain-containing diguanylate cyclase [Psychromonas ossibalaenae]
MEDKKLCTDALLLKINQLESVLNNVGAYIYTKDIHGNYTFTNQPLLNLFNKSCDQVIGRDASHFFDFSFSDSLRRNDQQVMRENITLETEESNFVKALGESRVFKTIKKPLHNARGDVIGMCGISTDITEQKKYETIIKEQKQLLDAVLDNVDSHIYMKDHLRTYRYVNRKAAGLFGLPVEDIIGKKDIEVIGRETADNFWISDKQVLNSNQKQTCEEIFKDENNNPRRYMSVKMPYQINETTPAVIGFSTDITELYKLKEELQKQANTDSLTGLNNHRFFIENAQREYHRAGRYHLPLTVMTLDIDNFKFINDNYGHPAGDQVLTALSQSLLSIVRFEDVLARTGGEEFSVLLPETDMHQAGVLAERIRFELQKLKIAGSWSGEIKMTVSIGLAALKKTDDSFEALFSRADKALYKAKKQGKNRVCTSA